MKPNKTFKLKQTVKRILSSSAVKNNQDRQLYKAMMIEAQLLSEFSPRQHQTEESDNS